MDQFFKFTFGIKLYMFRRVPLSIIRSFSLYTQQCYMSYRFCWELPNSIRIHPDPANKESAKPVWHIPLLCVQWKTPDDGQRNCPKYVEFYSKNKLEKLVHLVGFIIRIILLEYTWRVRKERKSVMKYKEVNRLADSVQSHSDRM